MDFADCAFLLIVLDVSKEGMWRDAYLRNRFIIPIILRFAPQLREKIRPIDQNVVQAIAASLENGDGDIGILAQASSDDQAGGPTATDNVV